MDSRIVTGLVPETTNSSEVLGKLERYGAINSFSRVLNVFIAAYEDPRDAKDARKEILTVCDPLAVFREDEVPADLPNEKVKKLAQMGEEGVLNEMRRFGRVIGMDNRFNGRTVLYEDPRDAEDASFTYGLLRVENEVYLPLTSAAELKGGVFDEMGRFGTIVEFKTSSNGKKTVLYELSHSAEWASAFYGFIRDGKKIYLPQGLCSVWAPS